MYSLLVYLQRLKEMLIMPCTPLQCAMTGDGGVREGRRGS